MDLALNELEWLICHKTKPHQIIINYLKLYNCVQTKFIKEKWLPETILLNIDY